jgi:hypothetical protein
MGSMRSPSTSTATLARSMSTVLGAGGRSAVVTAIDVTYVLREGDCRDGLPIRERSRERSRSTLESRHVPVKTGARDS